MPERILLSMNTLCKSLDQMAPLPVADYRTGAPPWPGALPGGRPEPL